jgi:hypothetical protein
MVDLSGHGKPRPYQNYVSMPKTLRLQLLWTIDNADGPEANPYVGCFLFSPVSSPHEVFDR